MRTFRASLLTRRRFQLAGALAAGALLPWSMRAPFQSTAMMETAGAWTLAGNAAAILIAFWMRLSIETYPGIQRAYVIFPSALTGHGLVLTWFALGSFPYDRLALSVGFLLHVMWLYLLYIYAERGVRRRYALVPFGSIDRLLAIDQIEWHPLSRPRLHDARNSTAIVADFSADLPSEWEAFLADAALAGRVVFQVKQLCESLSGRVAIEHLSENSFGSLVPMRGYFYLKSFLDIVLALLCLPVVLPLGAVIAVAIKLDSRGSILFRQVRPGQSGKPIVVYKFRTMRPKIIKDKRRAAVTELGDDRITRVGRVLRRMRLDELPQIINILRFEMSWIGPRPEALPLAGWYTDEIPFYRYRHVVKPGITGWAQVNQGHVAGVDQAHEKLQYDFYYIKYFSPWLDLLILFRTIKTMLTGRGAR
jgi:lipopolysaccharide/colanic/teichoic acid biosynthesis glycosyltransferase